MYAIVILIWGTPILLYNGRPKKSYFLQEGPRRGGGRDAAAKGFTSSSLNFRRYTSALLRGGPEKPIH